MRIPFIPSMFAAVFPASMAQAHPHIFVATEITVIYEGNVPKAIDLTWIYDDYFSLLITTDLGLDLDGDMQLSPEEQNTLATAVTQWPADFMGDLEVMQGGEILALAPRIDHRMTFDDGIVREIHRRPIAAAVDPTAPMTIRAYDPSYYVAYDLVGPIQIEGRDDCEVLITPANLDRAYTLVEELLYGRPAGDVGPDEAFPEVGAAFADTIEISCAALG